MVKNFDRFIDYPARESNHIQCFCHIINLVCMSIIGQFDLPKKKNTVKKQTKPQGGKRSKKSRLDEFIQDSDNDFGVDSMDIDNILDNGSEIDDKAAELMELAGDIEDEEEDAEDEANK